MITAIRRMFSSTLGKILALGFVAFIGVAFALSDVTGNSTFGGIGGANVAKVGSEQIGVGELRDRVRLAYNQARQDQPGMTMAAFVNRAGSTRCSIRWSRAWRSTSSRPRWALASASD